MEHSRFIITILFSFLVISITQAQDSLGLKHRADSVVQQLEQKNPKKKVDSLSLTLSATVKHYSDSISFFKQKIRTDSLQLDSLQQWYQRQQVRIKNYPQSKAEKLNQLDTLKTSFESKKKRLEDERAKHAAKIEKTTSGLEETIARWKTKIRSALSPTDSLSSDMSGKLGNQTAPDVALPSTNLKLPAGQSPNVTFPTTNLPALDVPQVDLPNTTLPTVSMPELNAPNLGDVSSVLSIPAFEEAQKTLGELKGLNEQVGKYKKDIDSLDREKVEKHLENAVTNQVKNLDEIKALEKAKADQLAQAQKLKEYQDMMRQYQDKDFIEEQMEKRSMTLANDLMVKEAPKVIEAQKKVTASRKKYRQFGSLDEAKKHRFNSLKGKSFGERFYYGVGLQFQKQEYQEFFVTPLAYYRLLGRLALGTSFLYRGQFTTKPKYEWLTDSRLYGGSAFVRINLVKSFFIQTDFIRTNVKQGASSDYTNHCMAGLGRTFRMGKRVGGEVIAMYNFTHKNDDVFPNQLNFRTNFMFGKAYK